nr:MAG TPA: hypothetical protein [Caudoviricetes sp.]
MVKKISNKELKGKNKRYSYEYLLFFLYFL